MNIVACIVVAALAQVGESPVAEERAEKVRSFISNGQAAVAETNRQPAVHRGLQWLVRHQHFDGGWSLGAGPAHPFGYPNPGQQPARMAATSLALLALLGAGNTPDKGKYKLDVEAGVHFLASQLKQDGPRVDARGDGDVWSQTLASLVLCELVDMTKDPKYREPARAAAAQLLSLQDEKTGGWRRTPAAEPDLETSVWAVLALQSGRLARLAHPQESFVLAHRFFDGHWRPESKRFRAAGGEETPAANALCLTGRAYAGWPGDRAELTTSVQQVLDHRTDPHDALFDFTATLVMHHREGQDWTTWNSAMRERLIRSQSADGSWHDPQDRAAASQGRLYQTVLRLLALETYYRHLPIFSKLAP